MDGCGSGRPPTRVFSVSPRRTVQILLVAIVALNAGNAVSIALGADSSATRYLLLSLEQNPSTWFTSLLMALAGLLALAVGRSRHDAGNWNLVSGVLWLLSIDEVAMLHERLGGLPVIPAIGSRGWAGAGLILAAVVGFRLLGWALTLESDLRRALLAGGALFLGGAIGLEVLSGNHQLEHGSDLVYWTMATLEENLEILGILLVARALLRHLAGPQERIAVVLAR